MSEWIKCSDKLPNEYEDIVFCAFYNGKLKSFSGWFDRNNFEYLFHSQGMEFDYEEDVTHWMPLPKPPKE